MKKLLLFSSLFVLASCGDYQTGKDIQSLENKIDSLEAKVVLHERFLINMDTTTAKWRQSAAQAINSNTEQIKNK